jgi:hypothetical protein
MLSFFSHHKVYFKYLAVPTFVIDSRLTEIGVVDPFGCVQFNGSSWLANGLVVLVCVG